MVLNLALSVDDTMPCSCPPYLISRVLFCKHIVRTVNIRLQGFNPKDDLSLPLSEGTTSHHFATPRFQNQKPLLTAGLSTTATALPTKRILRNVEDCTVIASGPGLAAEKATRTHDEGVIHEEMLMAVL
jgi:hypothetical protein